MASYHLKKTKSSSSIASSVSLSSSSSSGASNKFSKQKTFAVSNRIYQQKECEDLTSEIDEAQRNIFLYKYASLKDKHDKLKLEEQELMQTFETLKDNYESFLNQKKQSKQVELRKLYLLKNANNVGDILKQFAELIVPYYHTIVPLMISDQQFDRIKESIEIYNEMNLSGNCTAQYETIRNTLNMIEELNLPESFLPKVLDGSMYDHLKKICKQCDEQNKRILELNQTTGQYADILKTLQSNNSKNNNDISLDNKQQNNI